MKAESLEQLEEHLQGGGLAYCEWLGCRMQVTGIEDVGSIGKCVMLLHRKTGKRYSPKFFDTQFEMIPDERENCPWKCRPDYEGCRCEHINAARITGEMNL